ncbi:uncharacterized protein ACNS7B_017942 [Menidia menidia]
MLLGDSTGLQGGSAHLGGSAHPGGSTHLENDSVHLGGSAHQGGSAHLRGSAHLGGSTHLGGSAHLGGSIQGHSLGAERFHQGLVGDSAHPGDGTMLPVGSAHPGGSAHPLLSQDLGHLSLDWSSRVPDLVLARGLRVGSRFGRALAALLYLVHGNMRGPGRPPLGEVRPLLYAGVKLRAAAGGHAPGAVLLLLLTHTHLALLREEALGSGLVSGGGLD